MSAARIAMSNAILACSNGPGLANPMENPDVLAGAGSRAGRTSAQTNHGPNQIPWEALAQGNMVHVVGIHPPGMETLGGVVPGMAENRPSGPGAHIWQGNLHLRGHHTDMVVPCVALSHPTPHRPAITDAIGWPSQMHCDLAKLQQCANVFGYMNDPTSQWYVRFAPIDENGAECQPPEFAQLVKVMADHQVAFELHCDSAPSSQGMLYLWGMQMSPHGYSLLGVFRPCPALVILEELEALLGKFKITSCMEAPGRGPNSNACAL